MCDQENHRLWLTRGKQRLAVARSMTGLLSGSQLLMRAQQWAPRLTARDLRAILRSFEARKLITCINPEDLCGRLFCPTTPGASHFESISGRRVAALPDDVDFTRLAFLMRGRVRREVFLAIASEPLGRLKPRAASTVKKALRERCPVTLNQTIRALRELQHAGLILTAPSSSRLHSYGLTDCGIRLARFLTHSQEK